MGGKRTGKWQYLHLPGACLILCLLAACAPQPLVKTEQETCGRLTGVHRFIEKGDFDGAMKESQRVLARSPLTPPGDEALLNMGLISVHYANPRRDFKKGLAYFHRLENEFPASPLAEEARIWIGVLQSYEKAKQVDLDIEHLKEGLGK